jgi:penicillin-binding protein 1B
MQKDLLVFAKKHWFKIVSFSCLAILISLIVWLFQQHQNIQERIQGGWFRPPVEMYARGETLVVGQNRTPDDFAKTLASLRYRERFEGQTLTPHSFSRLDTRQCEDILNEPFGDDYSECIYLQTPDTPQAPSQTVLVAFHEGRIKILATGLNRPTRTDRVELAPQLFAQFYEGEPILRKLIQIGDVPLACLQATTAIEDSQFLEHKGVSVTGLMRALARNLVAGRYAQGGSTITQQLVKNYFLTPEKTLRRKISELLMAVLLETSTDKDQILENYLNVIYMGQRGPFQVIGFGAASEHYFNKPLGDLDLPECALLAAIINSPGRFDPFSKTEASLQRRNFVLDRMVETNMLAADQGTAAKSIPLPEKPQFRLSEPAPYFTQAVYREIDRLRKEMGFDLEKGLKIYTTLDVQAQESAQKKTLAHVQNLESGNKKIAKIKASGKNLEASLISVDVATGGVIALVGGRQYVKTQYNRVMDSHRQVGSIMKPFVYLAAIENANEENKFSDPTTIVDDVAFIYRYEGQSWSPKNYTNEFYGRVPLFYALKNSLNAATAQVGLKIGLDKIIDLAERAGITESVMQPLPSLTLGAFEIYPREMAQAYLTLARFGERIPLHFLTRVTDANDQLLYQFTPEPARVIQPADVAILLGMMKQTLNTGTARLARLQGFQLPAAGKTGTTSDTKDTWFLGMTPDVLTLTWTGYDDNTPTGLTGASGALPLWVAYMKDLAPQLTGADFSWPPEVEKFEIDPDDFEELVSKPEPYELEKSIELIRKK